MSDRLAFGCVAFPLVVGVIGAGVGLASGLGWLIALLFYAVGTTGGFLVAVGAVALVRAVGRRLPALAPRAWVGADPEVTR